MIRRVLIAYYVELLKQSRHALPWVGVAAVLGVVVSTFFVYPIERDSVTDFGFIAVAVPTAFNLVGFLMVLIFSTSLVASETESGSIRLVLVRPIGRGEYLSAKLLIACTYAFILSVSSLLVAWLLAMAFGELTGVVYGDELLYTSTDIYAALGITMLLDIPPQFACAAFGIFVSTWVRRTGTAVVLAIGLWLLVDYIKYPLSVDRAVFTTYLEAHWPIFQDRCSGLESSFYPLALWSTMVSLVWLIACYAGSYIVFTRRNLGP